MTPEPIFAGDTPHVDRLGAHLRRVASLPTLAQEDEFELIRAWHEGGDQRAREKLLESHQRLVIKIARGYKGYGLPVGDLVSEGNLGMMQALVKFDQSKGFRFSTYALWWIKASIRDYVMRNWSLVRIGTTASQKKLFFKVRSLMESFESKGYALDGETAAKQVAQHLGVREEEVLEMVVRLKGQDSSLNAPLGGGEEDGGEWIDWLADEDNHAHKTLHEHALSKQKTLLEEAFACLSQRENLIMKWRRLKEPPATLDECGEKLNLSKERVRQIEAAAFDKLQKNMRSRTYEEHATRRQNMPS